MLSVLQAYYFGLILYLPEIKFCNVNACYSSASEVCGNYGMTGGTTIASPLVIKQKMSFALLELPV